MAKKVIPTECQFCDTSTDKLTPHMEQGNTYYLCDDCLDKVTSCKCVKCGKPVDPTTTYSGRCIACAQIFMYEYQKDELENTLGLKFDEPALYPMDSDNNRWLRFSQEDYEKWLTFDPDNRGYNSQDFKSSFFMRRLWVMLKLTAAGYTDNKVINDNMDDIIDMLDSNIGKIIGQKCKIHIAIDGNNKVLQTSKVLAHKGKVYLYI